MQPQALIPIFRLKMHFHRISQFSGNSFKITNEQFPYTPVFKLLTGILINQKKNPRNITRVSFYFSNNFQLVLFI